MFCEYIRNAATSNEKMIGLVPALIVLCPGSGQTAWNPAMFLVRFRGGRSGAQFFQQVAAQGDEMVMGFAGTGQLDGDILADAARVFVHQEDAVGQFDRFLYVMGDEKDGVGKFLP